MNNCDEQNSFAEYDSGLTAELERFQDEYRTIEFEAMTEVPVALAAYVSHQHSFDL